MIELMRGDILDTEADALVNTVNCVGVMGKGIALQFKRAFPQNYEAYRKVCKAGEVRLGKMFVFSTGKLLPPRFIINFPTKGHWKAKSRAQDIRLGLQDLVAQVRRLKIASIAVPPLGCGYGGLDWDEVRPLIEEAFAQVPDVRVFLYEPAGAPAEQKASTRKPAMTRARALYLKLMELYSGPGYPLSMLEVQKLAYFLQSTSFDLKLPFIKQVYGPYADNLSHVFQALEGHYTKGYVDGSRRPTAQVSLIEGAIDEANSFLEGDTEAENALQRVADVIEGFESPYGMELLASVHWVATREQPPARDAVEAIDRVRRWSRRKAHELAPDHIQIAWDHMREVGVLPGR